MALKGHGATIAMELIPVVGGVFTTIGELGDDITFPGLMRETEETTSHNHTIDRWITGVMKREELTFGVNFEFDHQTHDHLTGLQKAIINDALVGFRFRGPGGAADTDEVIMSGYVTNVGRTYPVRLGVQKGAITVRMTGLMKVDGVTVGT